MKKILKNDKASASPVIVYLVLLAMVSFLLLIMAVIVEPFLNLADSDDDTIAESISAPRRQFVVPLLQIIFPKGILLAIFLISSGALIMEYNKAKYKFPGG